MPKAKMNLLDRINRHLAEPYTTLEALKTDLHETYEETRSAYQTSLKFGKVDFKTILKWLREFGIPVNGRGGANYYRKGDGAAKLINEMDQDKLATMTAYEIGRLVGCSGRHIHNLKCKGRITCNYKRKPKS